MTPEKRKAMELTGGLCELCEWYNDCPAAYRCPPLEALIIMIKEAPEEGEE